MEELGGLERIEMLQSHENDLVYRTAHDLINTYFSDVSETTPDLVHITATVLLLAPFNLPQFQGDVEAVEVDATQDEFVFNAPTERTFEF